MDLTAAPVAALTGLGILIVVLGVFVGGGLGLIGLGLASIFGAGLLGVIAGRRG